jgi:hypothetical protein
MVTVARRDTSSFSVEGRGPSYGAAFRLSRGSLGVKLSDSITARRGSGSLTDAVEPVEVHFARSPSGHSWSPQSPRPSP